MRRLGMLVLMLVACQSGGAAETATEVVGFTLASPAFKQGEAIPKEFTADGEDVSPPLAWTGAPEGTAAFVLIVDDPDAPVGIWDHWIVINLPATMTSLARGAALPAGALDGTNSWGRRGYRGPAPPPGEPHRYHFKLYALRAPLALKAGATKPSVQAAMEGRVLGEATWIGTYGR